jgi:hypothetical protein
MLAMAAHLALDAPADVGEYIAELAFQVAPNGGRKLTLDLIAKLLDLVHPMETLIGCRRVLDEQEVRHDPLRQGEGGIALALPQVLNLLGEVREVERQVRPRPGEAPQLLRLGLGPGVEVVSLSCPRVLVLMAGAYGTKVVRRKRGEEGPRRARQERTPCPRR